MLRRNSDSIALTPSIKQAKQYTRSVHGAISMHTKAPPSCNFKYSRNILWSWNNDFMILYEFLLLDCFDKILFAALFFVSPPPPRILVIFSRNKKIAHNCQKIRKQKLLIPGKHLTFRTSVAKHSRGPATITWLRKECTKKSLVVGDCSLLSLNIQSSK